MMLYGVSPEKSSSLLRRAAGERGGGCCGGGGESGDVRRLGQQLDVAAAAVQLLLVLHGELEVV
jgi:hypothetical protein